MDDDDKMTSIAVRNGTKKRLDGRKVHKRETYDEVVSRMLGNEP